MKRALVGMLFVVACGKGKEADKADKPADPKPEPVAKEPAPKVRSAPVEPPQAPIYDATAVLPNAKPYTYKAWSFSLPADWKKVKSDHVARYNGPEPKLDIRITDNTLPDPPADLTKATFDSWTIDAKYLRSRSTNARVGMLPLDGVGGILHTNPEDPEYPTMGFRAYVTIGKDVHYIEFKIFVPPGSYAKHKVVIDGIAASMKIKR